MAKKNKVLKVRSLLVLNMILTRKGGRHRDQHHHANKTACRGKHTDDG